MFIRTRTFNAPIFYLGPSLDSTDTEMYSLVSEVVSGQMNVHIDANGVQSTIVISSEAHVSDGLQHYIRVQYTRENGLRLTVDENHFDSPSTGVELTPEVLYLGKHSSASSTR